MHYSHGNWNIICQRSGFKVKADDVAREWTGLFVRDADRDSRHPQDFIRARPDNQSVPSPRPVPTPVYLDPGDVTPDSY